MSSAKRQVGRRNRHRAVNASFYVCVEGNSTCGQQHATISACVNHGKGAPHLVSRHTGSDSITLVKL